MAPDDIELGSLVAKPRLQRPNPKSDAFVGQPGSGKGTTDQLSLGRLQSCEAHGAKQDGGGRRTRTFEVIRRLIYSQLPLPLGTLPRLNPIASPPAEMAADRPSMTLKPGGRWRLPVGRVYGRKGDGKVNQWERANTAVNSRLQSPKLPLSGTRDTSLP